MEIKTLFGLPAHPLLVHIPIVLIPLVAVGAITLALVPRWRRAFGLPLIALAVVAVVGVQLSLASGEGLEPHVERSAALRTHTELADSMRPLALVLLVVVVALVLLDRRKASVWLLRGLAAATIVMSVATAVRLAEVGHNGAKASWGDLDMSRRAQGGGDGD